MCSTNKTVVVLFVTYLYKFKYIICAMQIIMYNLTMYFDKNTIHFFSRIYFTDVQNYIVE